MARINSKRISRLRREARVRARLGGTHERPRLSVFRSDKHLAVQLIDDEAGTTVASASDVKLRRDQKKSKALPRVERARWVGEEIAKQAREKGILTIRFDRGSYRYHGLVKAVADGARKGGLKF